MTLVNVLFITYNHSKFVAKALDSVLAQQTQYDFKIIIGDDCSTDGTREIVEEYAKKYPEKIILSNPEKNIGASKNYIQLFEKCSTSKYMAYLEGDDYWTDVCKLQKQVDFMEANSDYTICFHDVYLLSLSNSGKEEYINYNTSKKDIYLFNDLIIENPIATGSCLFRNRVFNSTVFQNIEPYDDVFHLLYLENGKAKFLNENMGVYRIHSSSTWSSKSVVSKYESNIKIRKMILNYFHSMPQHKNNIFFYLPLATLYKGLATHHFDANNKKDFFINYKHYVWYAKKAKQPINYWEYIMLCYKAIIKL